MKQTVSCSCNGYGAVDGRQFSLIFSHDANKSIQKSPFASLVKSAGVVEQSGCSSDESGGAV